MQPFFITRELREIIENTAKKERKKLVFHIKNAFQIMIKLTQYLDAIQKIKLFHTMHDLKMKFWVRNNSKEASQLSCKKYCSFCCYVHVDILRDEAKLLAEKIKKKEVSIDHDLLKQQTRFEEDEIEWTKMPLSFRKCIFLSDQGLCQIYEDRPLSCRNLYVFTPPENCRDLSETKKLKNIHSEIIMSYAYFHNDKEQLYGRLPNMILNELDKQNESV